MGTWEIFVEARARSSCRLARLARISRAHPLKNVLLPSVIVWVRVVLMRAAVALDIDWKPFNYWNSSITTELSFVKICSLAILGDCMSSRTLVRTTEAGLYNKSEHRIDCKTATFSPEVDKQRKIENKKQTKTNSKESPCRVSILFLTKRISLRWQNWLGLVLLDRFRPPTTWIHINEVSHPTFPSSLLSRRHQLRCRTCTDTLVAVIESQFNLPETNTCKWRQRFRLCTVYKVVRYF